MTEVRFPLRDANYGRNPIAAMDAGVTKATLVRCVFDLDKIAEIVECDWILDFCDLHHICASDIYSCRMSTCPNVPDMRDVTRPTFVSNNPPSPRNPNNNRPLFRSAGEG